MKCLKKKAVWTAAMALMYTDAWSESKVDDPLLDIELSLDEIATPDWIVDQINEAEFELVDGDIVTGGDSINIAMPRGKNDDEVPPLPLDDDLPPLPIDEDPVFPPTDPVFPPADPIEPTPDPDLPVTSPDTPGWPDLPDPGPGLPGGELPFPDLGGGFNPGYGGENNPIVIIDQIVNLGQKIWKIVADNQPVLDIKYKYANAIPKGLDATELENFSPIQYKTFRFRGKNGYGAQVFDIAYTVVHRYGGKYLDTGHFLERVSVVPNKVEALWGYKVNFNVLNVSVANVGSKDEPIASMGVDAQLDVGTIIKKSSRRLMFEFRGDSDSVRRIAAEAL